MSPHWNTRTYKSWVQMRHRCHAPTHHAWAAYGGRGITVCERWDSFENFLSDMGERPVGTQLDRIDNDGHYDPSNCRWATVGQQARNRRSTVMLEHAGEKKCIAEWARQMGVRPGVIQYRLNRGWPLQEVLTLPLVPKKLSRNRSLTSRSST